MASTRSTRTTMAALVSLVAGLMAVAAPSRAVTAYPQARATTSLAGHHWRHRVQVDGRGGRDVVVLVGGKDLQLDELGNGVGHVGVRVRLSNGRGTVTARLFVTYFSVRTPWTPWVGATDLDRRGGKELVLGFSTGAHAQLFTALTYRGGRLRELDSPPGSSWVVNSSVGTGSSGWRCTRRGVESRSVTPGGGSATYDVQRDRYAWRSGRWVRTKHVATTVAADADGNPPASTDDFPRFVCAGLPRDVL